MAHPLPVIDEQPSSLRGDGTRNWVHPADVQGRFTRRRRMAFMVLITIYVVTPWIPIHGHPAVHLDIASRRFYLLGMTFNAQDAWLAFFLLSGIGFLLIVLAALVGRVWCGYACPQTVFLEGVFRRIERGLEGPRNLRIRRNAAPMSFDKFWRKSLKHIIYGALSLAIAHVFLSYFTSIPELFAMMKNNPKEHPEAFGWVASISVVLYLNFAFFREQLCLVVCPYGRLQSVLADKQSLVIGYDAKRGEPRGKVSDKHAGDCVSCNRCVVVCPTGIDIRNGLQLDCIGCANCVDACDEVMDKIKRPRGLVRYDSQQGLDGQPWRFLRPRLFAYVGLGVVGLGVASFAIQSRDSFEANALRLGAMPFVATEVHVRNQVELHVVNKSNETVSFRITSDMPAEYNIVISQQEVTLRALESAHIPVFATRPIGKHSPKGEELRLIVEHTGTGQRQETQIPFLSPKSK